MFTVKYSVFKDFYSVVNMDVNKYVCKLFMAGLKFLSTVLTVPP